MNKLKTLLILACCGRLTAAQEENGTIKVMQEIVSDIEKRQKQKIQEVAELKEQVQDRYSRINNHIQQIQDEYLALQATIKENGDFVNELINKGLLGDKLNNKHKEIQSQANQLDLLLKQNNIDTRKSAGEKIHQQWLTAAQGGQNEKLDKLVEEYQINTNYTDNCGNNAILYAAWNGQNEIIDYLVNRYKVDINSVNDDGETALDIAKEQKHQATIDLLISRGAKTGKELAKK